MVQTYIKTCYKCKRELSIIDFSKDRSREDGLNPECRECSSKRSKIYRENNKEKLQEKHKKYYAENRDVVLERGRKYRAENRGKERERRKKYYAENREQELEKTRKYQEEHREYYRSRNRLLFYDARVKVLSYLNPELKCEKCGIDDIRLLTIDHINNDGYQERKNKTAYQIYKKIVEMPLSAARKKYQVLCRNCNWLRRYEGEDEK